MSAAAPSSLTVVEPILLLLDGFVEFWSAIKFPDCQLGAINDQENGHYVVFERAVLELQALAAACSGRWDMSPDFWSGVGCMSNERSVCP